MYANVNKNIHIVNINIGQYVSPMSPSLSFRLVVLIHASLKVSQPLEYLIRGTSLVLTFTPLSRPVREIRTENRILCG